MFKKIFSRLLAFLQILFVNLFMLCILIIIALIFYIVQIINYAFIFISSKDLNADTKFYFVNKKHLEVKYQKIIDFAVDFF